MGTLRAFAFGLMAASAVGLAAVAAPAGAHGRGGHGYGGFTGLLDTDGDGKVSLAEIAAEQKRLFGAADVDGDGKLSVAEFRRRGHLFQGLRATTLFDLMDANGDRELTVEEISKPSERWFRRYDANGDGMLEEQELPGK